MAEPRKTVPAQRDILDDCEAVGTALDEKEEGEVVEDAEIADAGESKMVEIISLPSGKEYPTPAAYDNLDSDYFTSLGSVPWFNTEALGALNVLLTDMRLTGGYTSEIPFEWTRSWAWGNQCACDDEELVKRRGERL